ncbi:zinc ribbon domain-containing protein [Sulfobacillus harzensis]|uniref:Zinc ribbon domain-containing protein n=1 Tax=Sulfobacillus harzensis TaxID=2729629 RepID=A0A7Y0L2U5_9FIRM|nr:zinc ribbon domain-containing protein [Sulfobacillus harzensis]NMP22063.1 zinc ribbon domain-containing protein [Sulfobacillus harzensis]
MAQSQLSCPQCGETILPEDRFCFRCGGRLPMHKFLIIKQRLRRFGLSQWPVAIVGVAALVAAAYVVYHQSQVIAETRYLDARQGNIASYHAHAVRQARGKPSHAAGSPLLHPIVITTTTTYPKPVRSASTPHSSTAGPVSQPARSPTSGEHWVTENERYQNVQFSLEVPSVMNTSLAASSTSWTWGSRNTPYHVTVSVVSGKPGSASMRLGAHTYGTPISRSSRVASQQLFITWARGKWVEVAMTVPSKNINWLAAVAESVRVS